MGLQSVIEKKLAADLFPIHCEVTNESHMHNVPENSETHFKVVVVSSVFNEKRKVACHQLIYQLLSEELAGPVHALALHTYTEKEWLQRNFEAPGSPDCMGGSKAG